jgi:sigma-B regulation protein RsbU (phosphoserine phosphatase)
MAFCNAGHNLPYICKIDGSVEPLKMKPGFVLAGMEGMRYKTDHVSFQPKEKLVLYTDGVTEAINPAVEMYTERRLEEVLKNSQNKTTKDIVDEINASVYEFADTAEQFDDITILVVERT